MSRPLFSRKRKGKSVDPYPLGKSEKGKSSQTKKSRGRPRKAKAESSGKKKPGLKKDRGVGRLNVSIKLNKELREVYGFDSKDLVALREGWGEYHNRIVYWAEGPGESPTVYYYALGSRKAAQEEAAKKGLRVKKDHFGKLHELDVVEALIVIKGRGVGEFEG